MDREGLSMCKQESYVLNPAPGVPFFTGRFVVECTSV
jgi:hypothetical protein